MEQHNVQGGEEGRELALRLRGDEAGAVLDHQRQGCRVEAVDQSPCRGGERVRSASSLVRVSANGVTAFCTHF